MVRQPTEAEVRIICAKAKCEVWKERLDEGSCTFKEYTDAMRSNQE